MPQEKSRPTGTKSCLPYVLPFMVYACLTYAGPLMGLAAGPAYILKTLAVFISLCVFWPKFRHEIRPFLDLNAVLAGITAFILWVGLEGAYPLIGQTKGFNPWQAGSANGWALGIAGARLTGAALVVPVMEELFWRSFALRFLMEKDFSRVPLGAFSWFSFIGVSIAFGMEHHRWLPGILTGMLYAILLYQKKNLFSPILAHGVTNLLLGIYVLVNGAWQFW